MVGSNANKILNVVLQEQNKTQDSHMLSLWYIISDWSEIRKLCKTQNNQPSAEFYVEILKKKINMESLPLSIIKKQH